MAHVLRDRKNIVAGAVVTLSGLVAAREGYDDGIGSLTDLGPGFFPFALGCLLLLLGGLIALSRAAAADAGHAAMPPLDIRGGGCIVAGMGLFLIVARYGGLIPAAFVATFVAALGDRTATALGSILLGLAAVAIAVVLFHQILKLPLPLFGWG